VYDRVWGVEWAFPAHDFIAVPDRVADDLQAAAAARSASLLEATDDAHDDIGGGDPDLMVWRFTFRIPDSAQPDQPSKPGYRDRDIWPMAPTAWPPAVAQLAGFVAGVSSAELGQGLLTVWFSPSLTLSQQMADLVNAEYEQAIALIGRTLEPFRAGHTTRTGRKVPEPLIRGRWNGAAIVGSAVFYVGETAYKPAGPGMTTAFKWRCVSAGLDLPDGAVDHPIPGLSQDDPLLPVPGPVKPQAARWLLTVDGQSFRGPLPEALRLLTTRLRQRTGSAPARHAPGSGH
jgi:hypothetical protein